MSLSSLPRAITDRLNVDHLSMGMGDHDYVWRSVLHGKWGTVIQYGWPSHPYFEKARHYNVHPSGVECIDLVRHMTFNSGNAVKYIFRCWDKNGRQDIEKAGYYLRDGLRHADRIFLPSWKYPQDALLDRVVASETIPHRLRFFGAIKHGQLEHARDTVEAMLAAA